jgi:hypothetical protein
MSKTSGLLLTAILLLASAKALAEHGKVGAWHLDTETKAADPRGVFPGMPSMQVIAIKDAFRKKTHTDYCMIPQAVAADVIVILQPDCTAGPTTVFGKTMRASYTCQGKNAGSGEMNVTYDSPEHYTGESEFTPTHGLGLDAHTTYEGKWTGETCPAR